MTLTHRAHLAEVAIANGWSLVDHGSSRTEYHREDFVITVYFDGAGDIITPAPILSQHGIPGRLRREKAPTGMWLSWVLEKFNARPTSNDELRLRTLSKHLTGPVHEVVLDLHRLSTLTQQDPQASEMVRAVVAAVSAAGATLAATMNAAVQVLHLEAVATPAPTDTTPTEPVTDLSQLQDGDRVIGTIHGHWDAPNGRIYTDKDGLLCSGTMNVMTDLRRAP